MLPAAMLPIIMGMNKGEMRLGPRSKSFLHSAMKVFMPPMPLPT